MSISIAQLSSNPFSGISNLTLQKSGNQDTVNSKDDKKDAASINKKSVNKVIKELNKQKENLEKQRKAIVDDCLKKGEGQEEIASKTRDIDKELQQLEKQINDIKEEENRKAVNGKDDKDKKAGKESSSKAKNELTDANVKTSENLSSLLNASASLRQAKISSNMQIRAKSQKAYLDSEIAQDESYGIDPKAQKALESQIDDGISMAQKKINENIKTSVKETSAPSKEDASKKNLLNEANLKKYTESKPEEKSGENLDAVI